MATFKAGEENNYGGQGGSGFFQIKKNHGVKRMRFLYNSMEDVEGMSVHKVDLNGTKRYVNCLRNYNDPQDVCPLCAANKYPVQARLIIPVYNEDEKEVQLWDRGKTMFAKLSSIAARYATDRPLVSNIFEVERNGEEGDQKTTYEIYQVGHDDSQLEDFPEPKKILGGLVLDKTAEDMEYFLDRGDFPKTDEDAGSERRGRRDEDDAPVRRRGSERRTPSNRGEAF